MMSTHSGHPLRNGGAAAAGERNRCDQLLTVTDVFRYVTRYDHDTASGDGYHEEELSQYRAAGRGQLVRLAARYMKRGM